MGRSGMLVEGVDYEIYQAFVGDENKEMVAFAINGKGVFDCIERTPRNVNFLISMPNPVPMATFLGQEGDVRAWLLTRAAQGPLLLVRHPETLWRIWPAANSTLADAVDCVAHLLAQRHLATEREALRRAEFDRESEQRQANWERQEKREMQEAEAWLALGNNKQRLLAFLREQPRTCWTPIVGKGIENPRGSRYGGLPWMPHDVQWPVHDTEPMNFMLQFDMASMPRPAQEAIGLDSGVVAMFHPSGYCEEQALKVVIASHDQDGDLRAIPDIEDNRIPAPHSIIEWRQAVSFPGWEDRPSLVEDARLSMLAYRLIDDDGRLESLMREAGLDDDVIREATGQNSSKPQDESYPRPVWGGPDQLMGWPGWQQGNEAPEGDGWTFLLEIWDGGPIGDFFSGDGSAYIHVRRTPGGPEFHVSWQCG